jgi:hypothetical protein
MKPFTRRGKPKTRLGHDEARTKNVAFATISTITAHTNGEHPGEVVVEAPDGSVAWKQQVSAQGATFTGIGAKLVPGGSVTGSGGVREIEIAGQEIQHF